MPPEEKKAVKKRKQKGRWCPPMLPSYLLSSEKATKMLSVLQHKTAMKLSCRPTHHM